MKFTALGKSGHGSALNNDTAAEKIQKVINSMLDLRTNEKERLNSNNNLTLGDVTTINLTVMKVSLVLGLDVKLSEYLFHISSVLICRFFMLCDEREDSKLTLSQQSFQ